MPDTFAASGNLFYKGDEDEANQRDNCWISSDLNGAGELDDTTNDDCLWGADEGIRHEKDHSTGKADHEAAKDKRFHQDDSCEAEKTENLSGCVEGQGSIFDKEDLPL